MGKSKQKGAATPRTKGFGQLDAINNDMQKLDSSSSSSSSSAIVFFVPAAILTATLPGYLFSSPMFTMPLEDNMVIFGIITLVTTAMLLFAYTSVADNRYMTKSRELGIMAQADGDAKKAAVSQCFQQTVAFSLWKNNVYFMCVFLFLGFVVLRPMTGDYPQINYALSTVVPAVCSYGYLPLQLNKIAVRGGSFQKYNTRE